MSSDDTKERWTREAAFFDAKAGGPVAVGHIAPEVVARYRTRSTIGAVFPLEHALGALGDLTGRRVLDVGSGEGQDAVLLATFGARVVGVEVSPQASERARRFAEASGVADRVEFVNTPVEQYVASTDSFDVVWCHAVLHHVLGTLPSVLSALRAALRPGGTFVAIEPVSTSAVVRSVRKILPIVTDATPDERPLRDGEIAQLQATFPPLESRYFRAFGRISRWLLPGGQFETAAPWRRALMDGIGSLDRTLVNGGGMRGLASVAVFTSVRPG